MSGSSISKRKREQALECGDYMLELEVGVPKKNPMFAPDVTDAEAIAIRHSVVRVRDLGNALLRMHELCRHDDCFRKFFVGALQELEDAVAEKWTELNDLED